MSNSKDVKDSVPDPDPGSCHGRRRNAGISPQRKGQVAVDGSMWMSPLKEDDGSAAGGTHHDAGPSSFHELIHMEPPLAMMSNEDPNTTIAGGFKMGN
jgi:hypothetical protein